MLEAIISSQAKIDVLGILLSDPDRSYYQRELSHLSGHAVRAVQRELEKFTQAGIVITETPLKRVYYRINLNCPIYEELRALFLKTRGVIGILRKILDSIPGIQYAFVYGSFAKKLEQAASDIDLMVIGTISSRSVSKIIRKTSHELRREVNYALYDISEYRELYRKEDMFIRKVTDDRITMIVGDQDEFKKICK